MEVLNGSLELIAACLAICLLFMFVFWVTLIVWDYCKMRKKQEKMMSKLDYFAQVLYGANKFEDLNPETKETVVRVLKCAAEDIKVEK